MDTLLYYDPEASRRRRVVDALSTEFRVECFASFAELRIASVAGRHVLALAGDTVFGGQAPIAREGSYGAGRGSLSRSIVLISGSPEYSNPRRDAEGNDIPLISIPDDDEELRRTVRSIVLRRRECEDQPAVFTGTSDLIRETARKLLRYAKCDAPLLILGETGTGKEIAARAAHFHSKRSGGPFIAINCANLSEGLVESEMFGTVRGAFTDAVERSGSFGQADGGTLFLDEIGSLSPQTQPRLLRAIENGGYRRLGGSRSENSDARIISASCFDPNELAERGAFRYDLLYRIGVLVLRIPPLRDRIEDVEPLARHFCLCLSGGRCEPAPEAVDKLRSHLWPGNVRELRAVLMRAIVEVGDGILGPDDISFNRDGRSAPKTPRP